MVAPLRHADDDRSYDDRDMRRTFGAVDGCYWRGCDNAADDGDYDDGDGGYRWGGHVPHHRRRQRQLHQAGKDCVRAVGLEILRSAAV